VWSRRTVLGAALVLTASACTSTTDRDSTEDQAGRSGVNGVTDVDVGCPPSPDATSCPRRPLAARLRFIRQDRNAPDVEIRSGEDGTFTVELLPGRYEIVADNLTGTPYPRAERMTVEVHEDEFTPITVMFDSGVR
jgi:hypothetical protein